MITRKIGRLIAAVLVFSSVLVAGLIGTTAVIQSSRTLYDAAEIRLQLKANYMASQLDLAMAPITAATDNLGSLAETTLNPEKAAKDPAYLDQWAEQVAPAFQRIGENTRGAYGVYFFLNPEVFGRECRVVFKKNAEKDRRLPRYATPVEIHTFAKTDPSVAWFWKPIRTGKTVWSDPYYWDRWKMMLVTCSRPIIIKGKTVGIVGIDTSFGSFQKMVLDLHPFHTGTTSLLNDALYFQADHRFSPENRLEYVFSGQMQDVAARIRTHDTGVYHGVIDGQSMTYSFAHLRNGYVVLLQVPTAVTMADMINLRNMIIALMAAVILLSFLAAALVGPRIAGPIETATRHAAAIAEGDFSRVLPAQIVERKDEIGLLGQSLARMTVNLQSMIQELRSKNEDISAREEEIRALYEETTAMNEELTDMVETQQRLLDEVTDLYNNAPVGYHSLNAQGRIVRINQTELSWLGYKEEEMLGRSLAEFLTPASAEVFRERFELFKRTGSARDIEYDLVRKDGSLLPVLLNASQVCNPDGSLAMSRATIYDVTDRKAIETEIRRMNAELEQRVEERTEELRSFTQSVAHDLQAPVRGILGLIRILEEDAAEALDEDSRGVLQKISASAKRMADMMDSLLSLSRVGYVNIRMEPCNVSHVSDRIVQILREQDPGRQVEIEIQPDMVVKADKNLLDVVMQNLIGNAWKYSAGNPAARISITAAAETDGVTICVTDNGVGFNEKYMHKLFTPFKRLHSDSQFMGSGIGLSIVERIVRRHGGSIRAASVVNEGASFYISFPN